MKTVLTQLKEKLQEKVNNPMSIQIECDIFQRVIDVIDDSYFEKEKQQIKDAFIAGNWDTSGIESDEECSEVYFNDMFLKAE